MLSCTKVSGIAWTASVIKTNWRLFGRAAMRPGRVGMTDRFDLSFYRGKTVLITGHTGFKGSWLSEILLLAGAKVIGYS